jgi:hypothetical protein
VSEPAKPTNVIGFGAIGGLDMDDDDGDFGPDSPNKAAGGGSPSRQRKGSKPAVKDAADQGRRVFKPLRDLVAEIGDAETREREQLEENRHGSDDRPASVVTYDVEMTSDPSGLLPRYVTMSIDSVRLAVLDKASQKPLINWRYEEIHGWIIGTTSFSIKVSPSLSR